MEPKQTSQPNTRVMGGVLIALGVLFFVALFFEQNLAVLNWDKLWPLTVIVAGALFFVGMFLGGRQAGGLAIPGSIITTVGLILLFQNTFNTFETWSYAWGLIVASVGVGQIIFGLYSQRSEALRSGWRVLGVGLTLFLVFGALMEMIFSITNTFERPVALLFPIGLTLLGLYLVVKQLLPRREGDERGPQGLFWPVLLAGLGLLWTLAGLNLFDETQVLAMLNLWPLMLMFIGLDLIFGRRNALVGAALALVLVLALFAFVALGSPQMLSASLPWLYNDVSNSGSLAQTAVIGQGEFITEERPVRSFTQVEVQGVGTVEIVQGESERLTINAQENLLPYIETRVVAGRLTIGPMRGYELKPTGTILYRLTVKDLSRFTLAGSGEASLRRLAADELKLTIAGSGNIKLEGLQANSLRIDINGSGQVTADGQSAELDVQINGAGGFSGETLQAQNVSVTINGLGQVLVWAMHTLDVQVNGMGTVNYYGAPQITTSEGANVQQLGVK